jgi:transposase
MPRRVHLSPHLDAEELERRYRQAHDPVARSQWHMLWLLAGDRQLQEVATLTGYSTRWVSTVLHRYNAEGPSGVRDRRHDNPGVAPVLTSVQQAALQAALQQPPADGGLWTGPKVAAWITGQTGRAVGPPCGWTYLKRFDCVLRRPRPRHLKADLEAQAAFKRGA